MAYRKKRTFKKRVYKRKSFAPKKKRAIKKIVRQVISRAAEVKSVQTFVLDRKLVPSHSVNASTRNIIELGPDGINIAINQGTSQGQRVGNRIATKSLWFKGTLVPLPQGALNPDPRPSVVKMVIFYDKTDPNAVPNPFAGGAAGPFQGGGGTNDFQNDLVDMWLPFNQDRYRILSTRTFKLGYSQYAGTATTPATQGINQAFSNNDFKLNCNFSINLTKYYPKMVRFNDNSAIPTNRGLYCMFYVVLADGAQASNTWELAGLQFMQTYNYSDL